MVRPSHRSREGCRRGRSVVGRRRSALVDDVVSVGDDAAAASGFGAADVVRGRGRRYRSRRLDCVPTVVVVHVALVHVEMIRVGYAQVL